MGGARTTPADQPAWCASQGQPTDHQRHRTKVHLVTDHLGRVLGFALTAGQRGDAPVAQRLLVPLPPSTQLLADAVYDSDGLRQLLLERGTIPVIPNNPTRNRTHPFDRIAYRARNTIERTSAASKIGVASTLDTTSSQPTMPQLSPSPPC